jgi:hypothetical protein
VASCPSCRPSHWDDISEHSAIPDLDRLAHLLDQAGTVIDAPEPTPARCGRVVEQCVKHLETYTSFGAGARHSPASIVKGESDAGRNAKRLGAIAKVFIDRATAAQGGSTRPVLGFPAFSQRARSSAATRALRGITCGRLALFLIAGCDHRDR